MQHGCWQGEVDFVHADGSAIAVSQVIVLLRDDAGRPETLATIALDLRPQKRLEVSAARLLGSRCAVSGINSPVAQIIAQLGLDFSDVHTFQSLRDALRFAMGEVGALGRAR